MIWIYFRILSKDKTIGIYFSFQPDILLFVLVLGPERMTIFKVGIFKYIFFT